MTLGGDFAQPPVHACPPRDTCPGPCTSVLLDFSREEDFSASLGNVCSVSFTVKTIFPGVQREPPVFQCCPSPLILSLGLTEQCLAPLSLHPPFRYFDTLRFPTEALFSRLNCPISLSLPHYAPVSPTWSLELDTAL